MQRKCSLIANEIKVFLFRSPMRVVLQFKQFTQLACNIKQECTLRTPVGKSGYGKSTTRLEIHSKKTVKLQELQFLVQGRKKNMLSRERCFLCYAFFQNKYRNHSTGLVRWLAELNENRVQCVYLLAIAGGGMTCAKYNQHKYGIL